MYLATRFKQYTHAGQLLILVTGVTTVLMTVIASAISLGNETLADDNSSFMTTASPILGMTTVPAAELSL